MFFTSLFLCVLLGRSPPLTLRFAPLSVCVPDQPDNPYIKCHDYVVSRICYVYPSKRDSKRRHEVQRKLTIFGISIILLSFIFSHAAAAEPEKPIFENLKAGIAVHSPTPVMSRRQAVRIFVFSGLAPAGREYKSGGWI